MSSLCALYLLLSVVHLPIFYLRSFAPYEKRCIELLKIGKDKRCLKYCKKRLGTHRRGKTKREEMQNVLQAQRKAAK